MNKVLARLDAYEKLVRLDKPIGILLLLWPTLWGLWLARHGVPHPVVLWRFVLGTVLTRSAGCAINDLADRGFDAAVERTRNRPLAAGLIRPWEARGRAPSRWPPSRSCCSSTASPSIFPSPRRRSPSPTRSRSASSGCRRRGSASPSASASRWRTPHSSTRSRRSPGRCSAPTCCGPSLTTPVAMVDRDDDVRIGN